MPASAPADPPAPAHPPADERTARLPQRLRRWLAALGAVGAVMVALPLVQLLRYQKAEVQAIVAERAALDPVARAVHVQRGLLAHRDLAGQVLRGRLAFEPERRLRQGEVDDGVKALSVALAAGLWERAVSESDALGEDWLLLARQVGSRGISAGESDQAHGLLIEQTLQVIDLVADASPAAGANGAGGASLALVHGLPRLALQMAALAPEVDEPARERELAGSEAALARLLGRLDAALERQGRAVGDGPALRSPLADAAATAGATADRYFQLLRAVPGRPAELQSASVTALQAQWALFDLARDNVASTLGRDLARAEQRQRLGQAALAALGLLAAVLALRLSRGFGALPGRTPPAGEPLARAGDGGRGEAGRLLQRLRGAPPAVAPGAPAVDRSEPQPTLPPPA